MLAAGAQAPDFQLPARDGGVWQLSSALSSGPVLLAFFKVSCPVCQMTFPFLERLRTGAGPGAPQLMAVSQDDAASTLQFQRRFGGEAVPVVMDEPKRWPASNGFAIRQVPSLFLVEPGGSVSVAVEGFDKAALEELGRRFGTEVFQPGDKVPALRPG